MAVFAVGNRWVRKEPEGDDFDLIEVCGMAEGGGLVCPVIRPVAFNGESPMSMDPQSLVELYTREGPTDGPLIPAWEAGPDAR